MTCRACKHEFCWLCLEDFTPDHFNPRQLSSCAGRMFTTREQESCFAIFCKVFLMTFFVIFFPILLLTILIFIIPIFKYWSKFGEIRRRTIQINQMHVHDNRFMERDKKETLDQLGRCNLFGLCILSVLVFPITLVFFLIPLAIILLIWLIVLLVCIYNIISKMFFCCKKNNNQNNPWTIMA